MQVSWSWPGCGQWCFQDFIPLAGDLFSQVFVQPLQLSHPFPIDSCNLGKEPENPTTSKRTPWLPHYADWGLFEGGRRGVCVGGGNVPI